MSKKGKKAINTAPSVDTNTMIVETKSADVAAESTSTNNKQTFEGLTLPKGRPTNPNSARQIKLAEMEAKREAGLLQKGRPTNPDSARQAKLKAQAERAASGTAGTGKTGRPSNPNSDRQKKIAERAEKLKAYAASLGLVEKPVVAEEPQA